VNNKPKKTLPIEKSIHINEKPIVEENNQWRIKCDIDQGEQVFRDNKPAYTSYKVIDFLYLFRFLFEIVI